MVRKGHLCRLAACGLAGGAIAAPAASAAPVLPDLVSDPPGAAVTEVFTDAEGQRLLMRFDGYVHNRGAGPVEIRGAGPAGGLMGTTFQRAADDAGGVTDVTPANPPVLAFEPADGHAHWHLRSAVRYSLWTNDRTAEVAPAMKVGFCLLDSQRVDAHAPAAPAYTFAGIQFCRQHQPEAPDVFMGISPGWRDVYGRGLPFQWVDVSDVEPGSYWLRSEADPDDVILESEERNEGAFGTAPAVVEGFRARPVARGRVPGSLPSSITLAATSYDDGQAPALGPAQYMIVTAPTRGRLNRPTGTWFSGARVSYTPRVGAGGPDTFTFAVRGATSAFPRTPRRAAVTLTAGGLAGGGGMLAISGAPTRTFTETATPLRATGPAADPAVRWSVDGVPGGDGEVGTVSPGGVYTAPPEPPADGRVVVTATGASGGAARTTLRVVEPPEPRPAPGPGG